MNLVPMVVLMVLNYLVYKIVAELVLQTLLIAFAGNSMDALSAFRSTLIHNSISKSHRRDTTMAALLFSIVIVFLLCHTTRLVLNIYEAIQVKLIRKDNLLLINFSSRWCIMVQFGSGPGGQTTSLGGTISCWWLTVPSILLFILLRYICHHTFFLFYFCNAIVQ